MFILFKSSHNTFMLIQQYYRIIGVLTKVYYHFSILYTSNTVFPCKLCARYFYVCAKRFPSLTRTALSVSSSLINVSALLFLLLTFQHKLLIMFRKDLKQWQLAALHNGVRRHLWQHHMQRRLEMFFTLHIFCAEYQIRS